MTKEEAVGVIERLPVMSYMKKNEKQTIITTALDMAIEALQEPQVGGWIPVTEKLPENGCGVLVTVNGKHDNIIFVNALEIAEYRNTEGWIIDGYLDWLAPDVTAWQPLPEPYEEREEE